MASIRDSQRQRLYDAEEEAFNKDHHRKADYLTIRECQSYADSVTHSDTWKALGFSHLPRFQQSSPIAVTDGRGRRRGAATSFSSRIKMPKWARMDYYVLHELAHIATDYIHNFYYDEDDEEDGGAWPAEENPKTGAFDLDRNVAAHGREYAGVLLHLVGGLLGGEAGEKLAQSFASHRVKYTEPTLVAANDAPSSMYPILVNDETPSATALCPICSAVISSLSRSKIFCSDACRNRHHSIRRAEARKDNQGDKVCESCGRGFTAKKSNARTCSSACRLRLHRERKRIEAERAVAKDVSRRAVVGEESRVKARTTDEATDEAVDAWRRVQELNKKWGVDPDLSGE